MFHPPIGRPQTIVRDGADNYFIKQLNNYTFYCNGYKILLFTKSLKTKFLNKLKTKLLSKLKIITIDIETRVKWYK